MKLDRGTLVLVGLDPTRGHEQRGVRPCIIVSDPDVTEDQRYPLLCVVPLTGRPGKGALYPELASGSGGLRKRSFALLDQIRTVDKRHVLRIYGRIRAEELDVVDEGLRLFLGLSKCPVREVRYPLLRPSTPLAAVFPVPLNSSSTPR